MVFGWGICLICLFYLILLFGLVGFVVLRLGAYSWMFTSYCRVHVVLLV